MALPLLPIALGAVALFFMTRQSSAYSQAPADGSAPPKKESKPPAKGWQEMSQALQEQVAAALGELGVSPATGELGDAPVSADAIKMATQTAALCESQGFYDIAKELRRHAENAARRVPTPPEAKAVQAAAPPGLTETEKEAIARTLTLDRDPAAIRALIVRLEKLPPSPARDSFLDMARALVLQLESAQSTTQTLQQIDQVIKSPGIAEVHAAVQPLPPAPIPVVTPAPSKPAPAAVLRAPAPPAPPVAKPTPPPPAPPAASLPQTAQTPMLKLDQFPDPSPKAKMIATKAVIAAKKWTSSTAVSSGADVKSWQNILKAMGYGSLLGTGGPGKDGVDGDYGGKSDAATRAFQKWGLDRYKDSRIAVDGVVGPITRRLVLMRTAENNAAKGAAA